MKNLVFLLVVLSVLDVAAESPTVSVILSETSKTADPGEKMVFTGNISNPSNKDIIISSMSFEFHPEPESSSEEYWKMDMAKEFMDTKLIIPPGGYSGPIFQVEWLPSAPKCLAGSGKMEIFPDGLLTVVPFRVGVKGGVTPRIEKQPLSQKKCVGEHVTLSVTTSGTAQARYQWRKNGVNFDYGAVGDNPPLPPSEEDIKKWGPALPLYSISASEKGSSLTIFNVNLENAGVYEVTASTGCGLATSERVQLSIANEGCSTH